MEIVQQVTAYVTLMGNSIVKKCPMNNGHAINVFRCIGLHTMMCTKQLTTKNLREQGAMPKMSLNRTSLFVSSWLLTTGYVCLLINHTSNLPIHMSMNTFPNPHLCPQRSPGGNQSIKRLITSISHIYTQN
jgi:hypothetical protein